MLVTEESRPAYICPAAEFEQPGLGAGLRREAYLLQLGLDHEPTAVSDKVDEALLAKLSKHVSVWKDANSIPREMVPESEWAANFVARSVPPSVIALISTDDLPDTEVKELLQGTLAEVADSRLYGGMLGSFVAKLSPAGLAAVIRLEKVKAVY